jgi:molecular chaperone DnaK
MLDISIDFGTSNSVISYLENDTLKNITDDNSNVLIPSTIYFMEEEITDSNLEYKKHYFIGNSANEYYNMYKNHNCYFVNFKRFLGITNKSHPYLIDFVNKFNLKYELDDETIYFYINNIKFSIQDIIKFYLIGLKSKINEIIKNFTVVNITFPAYFTDLQKNQLKKAYENAEFKINKMYNEPSMASIYFIHKFYNNLKEDLKLIILDIGGGTLDISVIEYYHELETCEIIDSLGNNNLGGIDIDNILIKDIYEKYNIDKNNLKWKNKIKNYAEEIKIKLTYTNSYSLSIENVPCNNKMVDVLNISYTRTEFNRLINNIIDEMIIPLKEMTLKHNILDIIYVGGVCEIPLLQQKTQNLFKSTKLTEPLLYKTIVANGACVINKLLKNNFCLIDVVTQNIGIKGLNDELMIMVNKNSKIPSSFKQIFTTSRDAQRNIDVEIYEGESRLCSENTFIGAYSIVNIPPNFPKGSLLIELLFKIETNGLLNISINGFINKSNIIDNFEYNFEKSIKLISNSTMKSILKKLLVSKK